MQTGMKLWLSLAVMLLGIFLCRQDVMAQHAGNISGNVRNEQNEPLPGVTVQSNTNTGKRIATTDAAGVFTFSNLPEGTYDFSFSYVGYAAQQLNGYKLKTG
jgi:hypothetical protein